jgi:hypothetical protein
VVVIGVVVVGVVLVDVAVEVGDEVVDCVVIGAVTGYPSCIQAVIPPAMF